MSTFRSEPDAAPRDPAARLPLASLAPGDAADWLRLQHCFALRPEIVAPRLESGATPDEIVAAAIRAGDPRACAVDRPGERRRLDRARARLEEMGARVVPRGATEFPADLEAIIDAPCVLLVRGRVDSLRSPCVAIVGARAATQVAREAARRLARELAAAGLTIVSGLARGIDAAAHRGALEVGGRTIAVLACGPDEIYPPEHRALAREIARRGAVVSEMPVGVPPRRAHFPLRNRLISGLSRGVIVVEARRRSGSLITVRHALGQGREVFVVPGAVAGPFAEGTNRLLRDGARPVLSAEDVLEDLGWPTPAPEPSGRVEPTPDLEPPAEPVAPAAAAAARSGSPEARAQAAPLTPEARLWALLAEGPLRRDELAARAGLSAGRLARALLELELAGRIVLDRDGRLQRNWSDFPPAGAP